MSTAAPQTFKLSEETAAQRRFVFHLTNTADGTNATGKTLAGADLSGSKNGAAFANLAGSVTELTNGWYYLELAAADLDTVGVLAVLITESGCDPVRAVHNVVATDQYVTDVIRTATAQAGAAGTITLDASASATNDLYNGAVIQILSGTGAGQCNTIADYVGSTKVATVQETWATAPDNTSVFAIRPGPRLSAAIAAVQADTDDLQSDMNTVQGQTLPSRTTYHVLGTIDDDESTSGIGMEHALDAVISLAGTFDGATITAQKLLADGTWANLAGAKTSAGDIAVAGPVKAVRCTGSSAGAGTDVDVSIAIRSLT
jgi:hypothetical protein